MDLLLETVVRLKIFLAQRRKDAEEEKVLDLKALARVIDVLPEDLVPPLVAAWVYDALPPNAERMVGIVAKIPSSKVAESPPDEWPSELNAASRRKFIDFARLATRHLDVMEIVNVLHAAAMRATSSEKKAE